VSNPWDDPPVEAQPVQSAPVKRGWFQFSLAKLLLAMVLVSMVGGFVAAAFRARGQDSFPIFVMLAAAGPLAILLICGVARVVLYPSKKKKRPW